jgi:hypothetical protein
MKYLFVYSLLSLAWSSEFVRAAEPQPNNSNNLSVAGFAQPIKDYFTGDAIRVEVAEADHLLNVTFRNGEAVHISAEKDEAGEKLNFMYIAGLSKGTRLQQLELVNRMNAGMSIGTNALDQIADERDGKTKLPCIIAKYSLLVAEPDMKQFLNTLKRFWYCHNYTENSTFDKDKLLVSPSGMGEPAPSKPDDSKRPRIGVTWQEERIKGFPMLNFVAKDSSAWKAGLREDFVLLDVNGESLQDKPTKDILELINASPPKVKIIYVGDDKGMHTVTVEKAVLKSPSEK